MEEGGRPGGPWVYKAAEGGWPAYLSLGLQSGRAQGGEVGAGRGVGGLVFVAPPRGGGGLAVCFRTPNRGLAHGLHPCFAVA